MTAPALLCLGEPLIEFNEQPDGRWLKGFGGDACNVAVAATRLGLRGGMITALGQDAFGDDVATMLADESVDLAHVRRDAAAATGVYFVRHGPDGHRFDYLRAGSAASRLDAERLPLAAIGAADALHLSGISQGISKTAAEAGFAAIKAAKAAGRVVSYDPNLRLALWPLELARAVIHAAMTEADVALPGLDDARQLTGLDAPADIARFYLDLGAKVCAITMGGDGVLVADADGMAEIPAPKVDLVDASGAGDCFDAAFLTRWLETRESRTAAAFAVTAASISVQGYGAIAPLPRRAAVEAALSA